MKTRQSEQNIENRLPALIDAARHGDQQAFTELYAAANQEVYRTARAILRSEELALDIQQDSFVFAFANLDRLEDPRKFRPWLRSIAVNKARTALRQKTPMLFSELENAEGESLPEQADLSPEASPELSLERKETAALVDEILEGLSDGQRAAVGMYYYEQMSVAEIADSLGVAPSTVKNQLARGRKKIESAVRALEQRGVKLYGLSPLPFLLALMKGQSPAVEAGEAALAKTLTRAGIVAGAKTAAAAGASAAAVPAAETVVLQATRPFFSRAIGKLVLGVICAGVVGGGVAGYRWAKNGLNQNETNSDVQVISSEDPQNETQVPTALVEIETTVPVAPVEVSLTSSEPAVTLPQPNEPTQPTQPIAPTEEVYPMIETRTTVYPMLVGPAGSVRAPTFRDEKCLEPVYGDVDGDGQTELVYRSGGMSRDGLDYETIWIIGIEDGWPVQKGVVLYALSGTKAELVQDGEQVVLRYTQSAAGAEALYLSVVLKNFRVLINGGELPEGMEFYSCADAYGRSFQGLKEEIGGNCVAEGLGYIIWREPGILYTPEELAKEGSLYATYVAFSENGMTVRGCISWGEAVNGYRGALSADGRSPLELDDSVVLEGMTEEQLTRKLGEPHLPAQRLDSGYAVLRWFTLDAKMLTVETQDGIVVGVAFEELPVEYKDAQ